jgi:hypothetical protein
MLLLMLLLLMVLRWAVASRVLLLFVAHAAAISEVSISAV